MAREPYMPDPDDAAGVVRDALTWGEYWQNEAQELQAALDEANNLITDLEAQLKEAQNG